MDKFRRDILKLDQPRKHKVKGSLGLSNAYKWYMEECKSNLTQKEFSAIIKAVNKELADRIAMGQEVHLPGRMGNLELRKMATTVTMKEGKVFTNRPVDWDVTLKLWEQDKESFDQKQLVRRDSKEVFRILYVKQSANYKNKSFYKFRVNRELKIALRKNIDDNLIDAFLLYGQFNLN